MLLYELPVGILSVPGDPSNAESTASQLKQTFVFGRILLVELGSFLTFFRQGDVEQSSDQLLFLRA